MVGIGLALTEACYLHIYRWKSPIQHNKRGSGHRYTRELTVYCISADVQAMVRLAR
jgi:hypothetical protein